MVVFTWSGNAAIVASRARPPKPIFAITPSSMVADNYVWSGVHALVVPHIESTDELITATEEALKTAGFFRVWRRSGNTWWCRSTCGSQRT